MLGASARAGELFTGRVGSVKAMRRDIDISGAKELRLLVAERALLPERVLPRGRKPGSSGAAEGIGPARDHPDEGPEPGGLLDAPSDSTRRQGYTRFQAVVGVDVRCAASDINPTIRFFVFKEKPDMEQLVQAAGETPVAPPAGPFTVDTLTTRIYRHALARDATPHERLMARELLAPAGKLSSEGLADLIWCIAMLPEFQLIQ
jgi:hypothetical protein